MVHVEVENHLFVAIQGAICHLFLRVYVPKGKDVGEGFRQVRRCLDWVEDHE